MLHTKFHWNRPTGSGEEDFKEFFYHICTCRPSWSCDQHHVNKLSFPCTLKLTYKIWLIMDQLFLRKASFNFSYVNAFGKGQEKTLTFNTHTPSFNSISCLHLPTFRSPAAIVSEKSTVFTFPIEKLMLQNLTLSQNRSRSTYGHHLNKRWTGVPEIHWFRKKI